MTNIPFGSLHFSLLLATQEHVLGLEQFGLSGATPQPAPKLSYLSFQSRLDAEVARSSINGAKIAGLTVVPLYKVE